MAKTKPKFRNTAVPGNSIIKKKRKKPPVGLTNEPPIKYTAQLHDLPSTITTDELMEQVENFVDRKYVSFILLKNTRTSNKDCDIHVLNKGTLKKIKNKMISVEGKEYKLVTVRSQASLVKTTVDLASVPEVKSSVVPASEAKTDSEEYSTINTKESVASVVDNTNKEDDFETRREKKIANLLFEYQPLMSNPDTKFHYVLIRKIATLEIEKEDALKRNTALEMEIESHKKTIDDLKVPIDACIVVDALETKFDLNKIPVCKTCEYIHEDDDMCSKKVVVPVHRPKPIYADDKSKWNRTRKLYYLFKEHDDAKVKLFVGRMAEVFNICQNDGEIAGSYFENLFPNESFNDFKVSCSNSTTLDEFLFLAAEVIADVYFLANLKVHTDINCYAKFRCLNLFGFPNDLIVRVLLNIFKRSTDPKRPSVVYY